MRSRRCAAPASTALALTPAFVLLLALGGCVGLPPKPKPVVLPQEAPLPDAPESGAAWPSTQWWKQYRDPTLDRLIDMATASSPTLAAAQARFESARRSVQVASAAAGADLQASGDFSRQRLSDNGLFSPQLLGFTWYNQADLGLQASYTFDWWGKQRAAVEAAIDEAHASQAERTAAALMLASSVADTYFGWQADRSRIALARRAREHGRARERHRRRAYRCGTRLQGRRASHRLGLGRRARTDRDSRRVGHAARRGAGGARRSLQGGAAAVGGEGAADGRRALCRRTCGSI